MLVIIQYHNMHREHSLPCEGEGTASSDMSPPLSGTSTDGGGTLSGLYAPDCGEYCGMKGGS